MKQLKVDLYVFIFNNYFTLMAIFLAIILGNIVLDKVVHWFKNN